MTSLRWLKPDDYHIRSQCGRFTVARRRISGVDWYIAYQRDNRTELQRVEDQRHVEALEIGATRVSLKATDAERSAAIRDMKAICEAAANAHVPTNHERGDECQQQQP